MLSAARPHTAEHAMIDRLYVNNFKCLVNFEYRPGSFVLMSGPNGGGKSTVLEVLELLRELAVFGMQVDHLFPSYKLTAWQLSEDQVFEIDIVGNGGKYRYRVQVVHQRKESQSRLAHEELSFDNNPLFRFDGRDVQLFDDAHSSVSMFPFDSSRSALSTVPEREDNRKLVWFRRRLAQIYVFSLNPWVMEGQSERDNPWPLRDLSNLASWYRHVTQETPELVAPLFESLKDVLPGFSSLRLPSGGESTRWLQLQFSNERGAPYVLNLRQLSEGQRCLLGLYLVLHSLVHRDVTLCFDEPDNYLASREMQPWLLELREHAHAKGCQCILASHHPEFVDQLAEGGVVLDRESGGPTRIARLLSEAMPLRPSELLARGWSQ